MCVWRSQQAFSEWASESAFKQQLTHGPNQRSRIKDRVVVKKTLQTYEKVPSAPTLKSMKQRPWSIRESAAENCNEEWKARSSTTHCIPEKCPSSTEKMMRHPTLELELSQSITRARWKTMVHPTSGIGPWRLEDAVFSYLTELREHLKKSIERKRRKRTKKSRQDVFSTRK